MYRRIHLQTHSFTRAKTRTHTMVREGARGVWCLGQVPYPASLYIQREYVNMKFIELPYYCSIV